MSPTPPTLRSPLAMVVLALLAESPMHAYRMQQLIRERDKDSIVNIGSRNSVHQVVDRLRRDDLVTPQEEDGSDGRGRIRYRITTAGRAALDTWMTDSLARPRNEYPVFPAALAFVALLSPEELAEHLSHRLEALDAELAGPDPQEVMREHGLLRMFVIEDEYRRAMLVAERDWVHGTLAELRSGDFTWAAFV